jgi:YVTN family beta-propeller protein
MYRRFLFLGLFASVFTIFPFRINNSSAAEPSFPIKATIQVGDSPQGIAVNPNTNRIYVTNYSSNSVSVIDGDTNTVIDTIAVGNAPQGIAVNPVTNKIYVANGNSGDPVYVIDGNNNAVIKTIPVAINARGVAVNPNTNSIYVTTNPGNIYFPNLEVIDGTSDTVIKDVIPVHYYAPSGIGAAVNTLNNRVFVETGNGTVSVLDGNTNEYFDNVVQNIGNGTLNGIDINPNTNLVYVAHTTANSSIFVIDGVTNAKLTPIPFMQNQSPQAIRVNPSTNHAFITTSQGFLWVLDLNTNQFFDPISITSGLRGIGINPLTNHVYVASLNDGTVRVFGDEPTPTPLPDLTVVSVRPIQVVENVQIN